MEELYRNPLYRGCIKTMENFITLYNELSKTFSIELCKSIYLGQNLPTTMVIIGGIKLEKFKSEENSIICYFIITREAHLYRDIITYVQRKNIVEIIVKKIRSEKKLVPIIKYL